MFPALMCGTKVEVWDEREKSRCREATLLAKDDRGSMSRSGMLIREFCRQRSLRESQFYWWQRKLKGRRRQPNEPTCSGEAASFALVSEKGASMPAGLELVLRDGRRLRISQGVEEETVRAVLAAMESIKPIALPLLSLLTIMISPVRCDSGRHNESPSCRFGHG